MRPWQTDAVSRIKQLLDTLGIEAVFSEAPDRADEAMGTYEGDGYLYTQFSRGSNKIELFIYIDEAAYSVNSEFTAFELPDWQNSQENLLKGFLIFLNRELRDSYAAS